MIRNQTIQDALILLKRHDESEDYQSAFALTYEYIVGLEEKIGELESQLGDKNE